MKMKSLLFLLIVLVQEFSGSTSFTTCPEVTDRSTYCEITSSWMCEFVNWRKLSNEWRELVESQCSLDGIWEDWEQAFECSATDDVECVNADQHICETTCNCTFCYCMDGKYQNWKSLFTKWKMAQMQYQQRTSIYKSRIKQCLNRENSNCDPTAPSTVGETTTGETTTVSALTTTVPEPTTTAHEPETMVPDPTTTNYQPTTAAPEPTTAAPEPTTTVPEPTTTVPEPTNTDPTTTTLPSGENCSTICQGIRDGTITNQPIALVTEGSAARIYPDFAPDGVDVYCDCRDGPDGAWTMFQRRMDGSVDFYRYWADYAAGFGTITGEFWLGLDKISSFTSGGGYELRFDLEDWSNNVAYAIYSSFSVADASTNYTLSFGAYSGTAGDALVRDHNGQQFLTRDSENNYCPTHYQGAWWFSGCYNVHLNGIYYPGGVKPPRTNGGIDWNTWRGTLKTTEVKFRIE